MPNSSPATREGATPPLPAATRERIVQVADELFYQRGFEKTSFADIADQVGISRGNFYHHFKSKDDILAAVIARRSARTQAMLDAWSRQATSPVERLSCFADMLIRNRGDIQRFGCPVGTLNAELAKRSHSSQADAARLFTLFRDWLREQFEQLHPPEAAESRALHLLALSQGIAALAQVFRDEDFIRREVALIRDWLRSLASAQGPADCTADDPGALA